MKTFTCRTTLHKSTLLRPEKLSRKRLTSFNGDYQITLILLPSLTVALTNFGTQHSVLFGIYYTH